MKNLVAIIRGIVGVLFIVSGMVKVIDPKGFSFKLEEYFASDVLNLPFLIDFALPISTFFVILEVLLGVLLLLGLWRNFTLYSLLGLVVFFSFLTFYSAYFDKVTDCGCFGDALVLTPWTSFVKDLILVVLISFLCWKRKYVYRWISTPFSYLFLAFSLVACSFISYRGIAHLPLVDFRAYAIGKNIKEGMKSARELGLPETKFETIYVLQNTLNNATIKISEKEYMSSKKYWGEGSVYKFIETKDKIIQKGYTPPIHDFSIFCNDEDKTEEYLNDEKIAFIITPFPSLVTNKDMISIKNWISNIDNQFSIVHLSTSDENLFGIKPCLTDATTLKTMIRANPGVIILEKATIKAKYSAKDLPNDNDLKRLLN